MCAINISILSHLKNASSKARNKRGQRPYTCNKKHEDVTVQLALTLLYVAKNSK